MTQTHALKNRVGPNSFLNTISQITNHHAVSIVHKNDLPNQQNKKAPLFTQVKTIHFSPLLKTKSKSCTFQTDPLLPTSGSLRHTTLVTWSPMAAILKFVSNHNKFLSTNAKYTKSHKHPKSMQCNPVNHCLIPLSSLGPKPVAVLKLQPVHSPLEFPAT